MGLKRETWCHFGKAWCHFVWFDWLACLPFCFVFLGCVSENVCYCICFYSWGLCSPCISLSSYSTCKDVFFKILHLCFKPPQRPPFPPPSPLRFGRGQVFAKAVIHASKRVKPTTTDRRNSLHQLPALKAPPTCRRPRRRIPHTHDQEYWELHRTL